MVNRQAAEESLEEQRTFLRQVIDANPNPVFVKDRDGRFVMVNEAMATLYGTTTGAILGKTDTDLNGKKAEVDIILRQDKEVIETGQRIHIPEEEMTDQKTGELSWFQTIKTPLVKSNGEVSHILGVATDISERKRAKDELWKANEELERRVEERTADLSKATEELQAEMNERRRAEQALTESEEHYRHIVETAQEGIWMLDAQAKTS